MNKQATEVIFPSQPLAKAIALAGKCLPASPTVPALGGIRIAAKCDGTAVMMASDSVGEITLKLPCETSRELDFVALGGILPHLGDRFVSDGVRLKLGKSKLQVIDHAQWSMPFIPGEEWPRIQKSEKDEKWDVELNAEDLAQALIAVAPVAPRNDANLSYNGVCLIPGKKNIDVVATNGHRLHHASIPLEVSPPTGEREVIIPSQLVRQLVAIIKSSGEKIRLVFGFRNLAIFDADGDMEFYIRGIDFKFPAWHSIKPGTQHRVELATPDFLALLKRISVQESDAYVELNFESQKLFARCTAKNGSWATDSIPLLSPTPGLHARAGFSLNYLFDAVRACDSDRLALSFSAQREKKPVLLQSAGGSGAFIFSGILAQRLYSAEDEDEENTPSKPSRENTQPAARTPEENAAPNPAEEETT